LVSRQAVRLILTFYHVITFASSVFLFFIPQKESIVNLQEAKMIKVVFDNAFYQVYDSDPAAEAGRMESIVRVIEGNVQFVPAEAASEGQITAVHTEAHIRDVRWEGLYEIASLAAGATIQAAEIGMSEPCMALVRPPGHHASADSAWGFCHFNNMAIALRNLRDQNKIGSALVLDIDLHFGDGTANILEKQSWVTIENPSARNRKDYLRAVERRLAETPFDIIGISAGFDHHLEDWGKLLATEDYEQIGRMVAEAALRHGGGCFAVLEGGYNHKVLGHNVRSLLNGMIRT
jgi:acetoin utilization deacetylase AcuC-like enzyme